MLGNPSSRIIHRIRQRPSLVALTIGVAACKKVESLNMTLPKALKPTLTFRARNTPPWLCITVIKLGN
jgi:hypothetical protein